MLPKKLITKRPNGTKRVQTINELPTETQQHFQDQCDVNLILKKYAKTGVITHLNNLQQGVYQDCTLLPSYEEAVQTVTAAEQAFSGMPPEVRLKFKNNPQEMIDFLKDPKNLDEAIKLGLAEKKEVKIDPLLTELQTLNKNLKPKSKTPAPTED